MNAHLQSTGLGAAISPDTLDFPIEFYAVASHLHYRHAGTGRVFRLILDHEAIEAENESEADDIDESTIMSSARIEECPADVIAHAGAVPLADWQIDAYMGAEWSAEEGGDLVRELADEADAYVAAHPEPLPVVPPVLPLTWEVVLSTLADLGRAAAGTVAQTLRARGVSVLHGAKAALEFLGERGLVEFTDGAWKPTDEGKREAAKIKAGLVALARD